MGKIVFAEFASVDLAELAARNVRHKFEGVTKIKIKYKHMEKDGSSDMEYILLPLSAFSNSSFGFGNNFPQSYLTTYYPQVKEEAQPASEIDLSSTVHVYADDEAADEVASYLRALGGLAVKISGQS